MSKNFKYLDKLIHKGVKEITLDCDIILNTGLLSREKSKYKEGIKLDVDDLVIDGNGHTIDACGKTRIFEVTAKNVTIKNMTLKNGHSYALGGAIFNLEGELTIFDSRLQGNRASRGGAIYNLDGELTVSGSTLTENSDCAIFNTGVGTVSDSTLEGNTASWGGAIGNRGMLNVSDSTLQGNTAKYDGGAIHNDEGGELIVSDSTLQGNTAEEDGGVIHNKNGNFKVFNCDFLNNKSPLGIIVNRDSLQFFNSNFMSNIASNIIVNSDNSANFSIFNGKFKDNDIKESIIFNKGKSCTVEKTIFEKHPFNTIINKSDLTIIDPKIKDEGKTILNEQYILIKKSSDELEDKIYGEGIIENENKFKFKEFDFGYLDKKIHESKNKEIMLEEDISFENYELDYYEGGIELDIDNLIIDGNGHTIDAQDKTRIFYCTGKNITIKNLTLKNGHSHKNYDNLINNTGGAIKIIHNTNLSIENCKFINNISEENGGAIYNGGELTVYDSTLQENTAKEDGGAIYNGGGELIVSGSTLAGNTLQGRFSNGAGIYNLGGMLTVSDSRLQGNRASSGGAIYNQSGMLTVSDSTLTKNDDGAILNRGTGTVSDSTLIKNKGRAISNEGELTISDSIFIENTAYGGGAISNSKGGTLTVSGSTLKGNTAERGGGAIHNSGELTVSRSTFTENTAKGDGGAIYLTKDSKKYESNNCTFKGNKPDNVYRKKINYYPHS